MCPAPRATTRAWFGLLVLILPCLLVSIDLTVLNLAAPSIAVDLRPNGSQLLWIVDIYGFLIAGSLITMGALGDRIGRRRLLIIGSIAFGLVSLLAAFSTSPESLIVARGLLGIAGATLMPSTVALIRTLFATDRERSLAIGIWSASFAAGWAIGPLVGGLLIERFWWGAVFLPALPMTGLIVILAPRLLPESRASRDSELDLVSALISLLAILTTVYGFKSLAIDGPGSAACIPLATGVVLASLFVRRQLRSPDPMIDFALFQTGPVAASILINFLATATSVATLFFVAQYLQLVLGFSPLRAGLWSLPIALASFVACISAPIIARRYPTNRIYIAGLALAASALLFMTTVDQTSLVRCLVAAVVLTIGLGPVVTLATDVIVRAAPPEQAARATACSETSIELGGAIGIALFGSASVAIYRRHLTGSWPDGISVKDRSAARETLSAAIEIGRGLPDYAGLPLIHSARTAFVSGIQLSSYIGVSVVLITAVLVYTLMRPEPAHAWAHPAATEKESPG
ncbi:MAG: MFS transporter [Thermomicrobiales bacterium]|nr:MFS transporter [Thermomicrobiales bacterium]